MSYCQDNWVDWLPLAKFAYNNHVHSTTHHTLFELDSGQHTWMGSEPTWSSAMEAMEDFAQWMSKMQEEAKAALEHAADEMAQYYNHWRSPMPTYKVRAKVWLNAQNYTTTHLTKKLDHKWLGPFMIKKIISPAAINSASHPTNEGSTPSSPSPTSSPTTQIPSQSICLTHALTQSLSMVMKSMRLSQL